MCPLRWELGFCADTVLLLLSLNNCERHLLPSYRTQVVWQPSFILSHLFLLNPCCCDTLWPKATAGKKGFIRIMGTGHSSPLVNVRTGTLVRKCKQKPLKYTVLWFACRSVFTYLSCCQGQALPGNSAAHRSLGPIASTNNQDNLQHTCPQANIIWAIVIRNIPFSHDSKQCHIGIVPFV